MGRMGKVVSVTATAQLECNYLRARAPSRMPSLPTMSRDLAR